MKFEEGMYIRYTRGVINGYVPPRIAKIIDCSDKDLVKIDNGQIILRNDILKSSKNIIDLIKIGDYVNGFKVTGLDYQYTTKVHKLSCNNEYGQEGILIIPSEIRNVVTKEQFDSITYEVEK